MLPLQPAVPGWRQGRRCGLGSNASGRSGRDRHVSTRVRTRGSLFFKAQNLKQHLPASRGLFSLTSTCNTSPSPVRSVPDRLPPPRPSRWSSPSSLAPLGPPQARSRRLQPSPSDTTTVVFSNHKSNHVTFPSLLHAHPNKDLELLIPSHCSEH